MSNMFCRMICYDNSFITAILKEEYEGIEERDGPFVTYSGRKQLMAHADLLYKISSCLEGLGWQYDRIEKEAMNR